MAQALLHEPDVLIMDEPTAGTRSETRSTRFGKRSANWARKMILLSTHILQEVQAMAERVLFIDEGRLVFDGSVNELTRDGKPLDERFRELTGAELDSSSPAAPGGYCRAWRGQFQRHSQVR